MRGGEKRMNGIYCDMKRCMYHRIWKGHGTCTLHYLVREERCPKS